MSLAGDGGLQRHLAVLYGSQSGCAHEVAERIERHARRRHLITSFYCMDDFELEWFRADRLYVMVASTSGQGVAPDNMRRFWRALLRKSLASDTLAGVQFTVFGLGDSSYPIYNAVARRLYQRMLDLGAHAFHERGLGDDQHDLGYDGAFQPWEDEMWAKVMQLVGHDDNPDDLTVAEKPLPSSLSVTISPASSTPPSPPPLTPFGHGAARYQPHLARLIDNRRVTPSEHFQDVRHIQFAIPDDGSMKYAPGDVLIVHPTNPIEATTEFLRNVLELDPMSLCTIERSDCVESVMDAGFPYGTPLTIVDLFTRWIDLFGTPRRSFFETLAMFADDEDERERLHELCSAEGQPDLVAYNQKERRTYAEVLVDFPSARMPLCYLLEAIPRLVPRQFSIASSPLAHPGRVEILVALLEFTTPYKRRRIGTCSRFFQSLDIAAAPLVPIGIRAGSFALSIAALERPLIMVGPGTGIAPFRSMCSELGSLNASDESRQRPPLDVFFGCRNRHSDYFFEQEWQRLVEQGTVSSMEVAFSRDQASKVYVQDVMRQCGERVWILLQQSATFFLAGSSNQMPRQVREALVDICIEHGHLSAEQGEAFVKGMEKRGRYLIETWG